MKINWCRCRLSIHYCPHFMVIGHSPVRSVAGVNACVRIWNVSLSAATSKAMAYRVLLYYFFLLINCVWSMGFWTSLSVPLLSMGSTLNVNVRLRKGCAFEKWSASESHEVVCRWITAFYKSQTKQQIHWNYANSSTMNSAAVAVIRNVRMRLPTHRDAY